MFIQTKLRNFCLVLGLAYVTLIGFGKVGVNFQATLFHFSFFLAIWFLSKSRNIKLSLYHHAVFILGLILSTFFSITTNGLVVCITYLATWLLTSILLFLLFEKQIPDGPIQYIQSFFRYCKYIIVNGLSTSQIKQFCMIKKDGIHVDFKKDVFYGLLISLPLLVVFHFLFVRINADYAVFMSNILEWVWRVIRYILDIELLWIILKSIIQGYIFYILLSVEHTKENDKMIGKDWPHVIFKMVLVSVVALFLIFSSFQSKLLLLDVFHLAFKEVSQYVQKGFIELLLVSFAGYSLSIFILQRLSKESSKEQMHVRWLLTVFCIELVTITVFIFHKLYALQAVFGFKDQRILASSAILLVLITFIFLLFRILGKISAIQIFRWQIIFLAGFVFLLNLLNVDLFTSKHNSIRYNLGDVQHKDYSYLLGNSYDNISEWPQLMKEAQEVGIPKPDETYYWGHFSSSRKDFYGSIYSPICEKRTINNDSYSQSSNDGTQKYTYYSYLEDRYQKLNTKYGSFNLKTPLTKLTTVNIREYQAYLFIQENRSLIDAFIEFAKNRCKE